MRESSSPVGSAQSTGSRKEQTQPSPVEKESRSRHRNMDDRREDRKRTRSPTAEAVSLYVSGLASRVSDEDLYDHFRGEGKIKEARVVMDPRTKESRGFGFVDYEAAQDAESAVANLDRSVLRGRVVMVEKAKRARPRTPTPGVYLSRGGREAIPTSRGLGRYGPDPLYDRYDRDRSYRYYDRYDRRSPSPSYRMRGRPRSPPPYRRRSPSPYPYRRRTPSPSHYRRRSISPY